MHYPSPVIPVKTGIEVLVFAVIAENLDSRLRGNDG
jgi:hypothetical protein